MDKRNFLIKKVKNTVPWTYVINDLQKTNQREFRIEKVIKKNLLMNYIYNYNYNYKVNYILNGKVMIVHIIAGLIKRCSIK